MSYIFKFKNSDKVVNYVNTFPEVTTYFYNGNAYLNNRYNISGTFTSSVGGIPVGAVSVYEKNVDRDGNLDFEGARTTAASLGLTFKDPFRQAVERNLRPEQTSYLANLNPRINSFITKTGTRINFKTVSTAEFNTVFQMGDVLTGSYPVSASIEKQYFSYTAPKYTPSSYTSPTVFVTGSVTDLMGLANILDYYQKWSPHFQVSSSLYGRDITSSVHYGNEGPGALDVGLLSLPSLIYGDSIKKGTIDLEFYVTGTLVGQLKDENRDGALIQTGPYGTPYSGSVAGVALYNEGFIILTGSWDMTRNGTIYGPRHSENFGTDDDFPTWVNFAQTISSSAPRSPETSCKLYFKGEHEIPILTVFANAPKNLLNHSNNVTYRDYGSDLYLGTGSNAYAQRKDCLIKNVVSSSYNDPTGSFSKTTYINKIGLYDKHKNLIGIAATAKPVKKLEERDLTFKLKLDF